MHPTSSSSSVSRPDPCPPTAATTVVAGASPLERAPDAVVAHMANAFLDDGDALRLARASRTLMHALQHSYRLKRTVEAWRVVQWTATATVPAASSSSYSSSSPPLVPYTAAAQTSPSLRIGLPVSISAMTSDALCSQLELDRLPSSVRRMEWRSSRYGVCGADLLQSLRLPAQLRELELADGFHCFDEPIGEMQLPPSLTALILGRDCHLSFTALRLPDGLRSLTLGYHYCHDPLSPLRLPPSITALRFGGFHCSAADLFALPPQLESLVADACSAPLDRLALPQSLTAISLRYSFDQLLDSVQWPQGLRTLDLGFHWNQSVEHLRLPDSLTELSMGGCTHPLDWARPPQGVTRLHLNNRWNLPASQLRLPSALTEFTLPNDFNQPLDDLELPVTLRSLTLGFDPEPKLTHPLSALRMPAGLTDLNLWGCSGSLADVQWPPSLTKLVAGSRCAGAGSLPDSLLQLTLGGDNEQRDKWLLPLARVCLPPRLQRLALQLDNSAPLCDLRLPPSLTALTLQGDCDQSLDDWTAPDGLRELRLGGLWNWPVSQLRLPPRLELLAFGSSFNQPVDELDLPPTLTELHLGCYYSARFAQPISGLRLPPNLRVLGLPSFGLPSDASPALLAPPAVLPPSLRELRIHENVLHYDWLSAWTLPPRCVVNTARIFQTDLFYF